MRFSYDDQFLEAAVFLVASGKRPDVSPLQIRRYHREREGCYGILDPDMRDAAFFKLHLHWFREWDLENLLLHLVNEYHLLASALSTLAFRKVRMKRDEGAELYVSAENGRSAVVALRPERFECDEAVTRLLRHEFMHLSDMLDPAFGYSPKLNLPNLNSTQQRITRERYRLLWDVTIDGRLYRAGRCADNHTQHQALFNRIYSFWSDTRRAQVFESHWNNDAPRHDELLALAANPRDLSHTEAPLPGSLCTLCQFPTFNWADVSALPPATLSKLRAQFPEWNSVQGVCERCVEIYELAGKFELPATVVL
jgi:hypothetical protein